MPPKRDNISSIVGSSVCHNGSTATTATVAGGGTCTTGSTIQNGNTAGSSLLITSSATSTSGSGMSHNNIGSSKNTGCPNGGTATAAAATGAAVWDLAAEQKQQLYEANAKLCRLVRKCPWMYDRNHMHYAKKSVLDKSWSKISKDCGDSVASCKERWRNIRAAFARSINVYRTHGGPNRVKPYYLHKELNFLVKPMMEGRDKYKSEADDTKDEVDDEDCDEEEEEDDDADLDEADNASIGDAEESNENAQLNLLTLSSKPSSNTEPQNELQTDGEADFPRHSENITRLQSPVAGLSHMQNAKRSVEATHLSEERSFKRYRLLPADANHFSATPCNLDADAKFLQVLLPDMYAMNARQKVIFKRKIYQSLEEVLDTTSDFPPCINSSNANNYFGMQQLSPTAQCVVNTVTRLSEGELQKLNAFMQTQLGSAGGATARQHTLASRPPPSASAARPLLTAHPERTSNAQHTQMRTRQQQAREQPNGSGFLWDQLVPITVKDEVEDVDIV